MREYRIFKTDLGWSIYKKKYIGKILIVSYLNGHNLWTPKKEYAKIFYHEEDAVSALIVIKKKDEAREAREKSD